MKFGYLFVFLLFTANIWAQQELSVISFKKLESDMDARVHHPEKDQNGKNAALIKIVTTERDFRFDVGSLGVIKSQQKMGEIWVYVPEKARKITISHQQLGVLRDYLFPESIVSGIVYELRLHSGRVETVIKENRIETQWIAINSVPEGANVFLNDQMVGKTPFTRQYPLGEYDYRIALPKFYPEAGRIVLNDEKVVLDFNLNPNYGNLKIATKPESGLSIFLDDESTDKTSPALIDKVSSGKHKVTILSDWYAPESKTIIVEDGKTTELNFELSPQFAEVSITSSPEAAIYINDQFRGTSKFEGRLLTGVYDLKITADKHYEHNQQLIIEAGKNQKIERPLEVMSGGLSITSIPFKADIYLNGKKYGSTPENIKDLKIGIYKLELKLEGYKSQKKNIVIKENEVLELREELKKETAAIHPTSKSIKENNQRTHILFGTIISHLEQDVNDINQLAIRNFNYGMRYLNLKKNGFYVDYSHTFNLTKSNFTYSIDNKIISDKSNAAINADVAAKTNIRSMDFGLGYVFRMSEGFYGSLGLGYYFYEVRQPLVVLDFNDGIQKDLLLLPEYSISTLAPSAAFYIGLNRVFVGFSISIAHWDLEEESAYISKLMFGYKLSKP